MSGRYDTPGTECEPKRWLAQMSWAQSRKKRGTGEFSTDEVRLATGLAVQASSGMNSGAACGNAHTVVKDELAAGVATGALSLDSLEEQQRLEQAHFGQR